MTCLLNIRKRLPIWSEQSVWQRDGKCWRGQGGCSGPKRDLRTQQIVSVKGNFDLCIGHGIWWSHIEGRYHTNLAEEEVNGSWCENEVQSDGCEVDSGGAEAAFCCVFLAKPAWPATDSTTNSCLKHKSWLGLEKGGSEWDQVKPPEHLQPVEEKPDGWLFPQSLQGLSPGQRNQSLPRKDRQN